MQLIDVSMARVRSAIITVQRPRAALRFVLFPMVHIGAPEFYQEVQSRLADCDVIVAEGVEMGSVFDSALAKAYRASARGRLGLVEQRLDLAALWAAGTEVINPDLGKAEFRAGWRKVPLRHRLAVLTIAPLFVIGLRLFGSRRVLASFLHTEDMPVADEPEYPMPALDDLMLHDRDDRVIAALGSIVAERADEQLTVGVVYGAGHMTAIVRGLAAHGYRPRSAEWLTVFDF